MNQFYTSDEEARKESQQIIVGIIEKGILADLINLREEYMITADKAILIGDYQGLSVLTNLINKVNVDIRDIVGVGDPSTN